MELGRVGIWTTAFDRHPSREAQAAAHELEELGYPAIWLNEAIGRDPLVMAALLLAVTSRITVATGIANIYARDAMTAAAAQKTLAEAYPDRFLLGLGVSSPALVAKLRGHDYSRPLSYMRSYLDAMDRAPFNAVGPTKPPARVLGALGPKMLKLAASHANGAHPYLTTPEHTHMSREILGSEAWLAPEQKVLLETDPSVARAIGRSAISYYLRAPGYLANLRRLGFDDDDWADPTAASDRLVDAMVAWGGVDEIVNRVREHHDAGADHVAVQVLRGDQEIPLAEWRELAPALL
ncbi:LLM class F420-dependent oxidoreductase [Rhodococcus sp. IEGM 1307]|uniref:LLM class F420-dependent oxidoreductase n=1 Tax=Rhodococcus sp. IEGM 1307 TaxID=3047091 RepID=UPI0024B7D9E8|nr:LLM class F420-dependent oxidoreductase [Rhodococcus sp. IEGM 1307]MDI9979789.1 LLM class F420-dependent oxidoreductase [Rhodococcus sp. IEGM 1307]